MLLESMVTIHTAPDTLFHKTSFLLLAMCAGARVCRMSVQDGVHVHAPLQWIDFFMRHEMLQETAEARTESASCWLPHAEACL